MLDKRLGQHFLRDDAVIDAIVAAIAPAPGQTLLEIGAGDGALTSRLAAAGARIIALEIDRRFANKLTRRHAADAGVQIIHGDALAADWQTLAGAGARLAGNLPYQLSSPLLLKMAASAGWLTDCHVMVQKEVAARVCAAPDTAEYGRLSVTLQLSFAAQLLFDVPPAAFTPPPAVDSAVLRLTPQPAPTLPPRFDDVLRAAFGQRRKTLKNALAPLNPDWQQCPIDSGRRAQTLSIAEFIALAQHIDGGEKKTRRKRV